MDVYSAIRVTTSQKKYCIDLHTRLRFFLKCSYKYILKSSRQHLWHSDSTFWKGYYDRITTLSFDRERRLHLRRRGLVRSLLQENVWSVNDITNSSYRRCRSRRLKWSRPEMSDISRTDTNFVEMQKIYTTHFHDILRNLYDIRWTIR